MYLLWDAFISRSCSSKNVISLLIEILFWFNFTRRYISHCIIWLWTVVSLWEQRLFTTVVSIIHSALTLGCKLSQKNFFLTKTPNSCWCGNCTCSHHISQSWYSLFWHVIFINHQVIFRSCLTVQIPLLGWALVSLVWPVWTRVRFGTRPN